jgi:hypothetical protein
MPAHHPLYTRSCVEIPQTPDSHLIWSRSAMHIHATFQHRTLGLPARTLVWTPKLG